MLSLLVTESLMTWARTVIVLRKSVRNIIVERKRRVWTGLICLRMGTSGGLLESR